MQSEETSLPGVLHILPKVFGDARGFFVETYQFDRYAKAGVALPFVQDNLSRSRHGVLRGLHLQNPNAQGKLVSVVDGTVLDVAVDVRVGSPHFGAHVAVELDATRMNQLWVPPGFAHGFVVLSEFATFSYKCTDRYAPEHEVGVAWDDPAIGIDWRVAAPSLSEKDLKLPKLADIPHDKLVRYEAP